MDFAFTYVADSRGIESEANYPYVAAEGTCAYNVSEAAAVDTGFVDLPSGNETSLVENVACVGPISVAIDASHQSFQLYSGGVYNEPLCSSTVADHAVLVVGYGKDKEPPIFPVRLEVARWIDRETSRQTDRQTDRQTGKTAAQMTDRLTAKQTVLLI